MYNESFYTFILREGIESDERAKGIAAEAWNAAVKAVCEYIGDIEGTDYGAEEMFSAEMSDDEAKIAKADVESASGMPDVKLRGLSTSGIIYDFGLGDINSVYQDDDIIFINTGFGVMPIVMSTIHVHQEYFNDIIEAAKKGAMKKDE